MDEYRAYTKVVREVFKNGEVYERDDPPTDQEWKAIKAQAVVEKAICRALSEVLAILANDDEQAIHAASYSFDAGADAQRSCRTSEDLIPLNLVARKMPDGGWFIGDHQETMRYAHVGADGTVSVSPDIRPRGDWISP